MSSPLYLCKRVKLAHSGFVLQKTQPAKELGDNLIWLFFSLRDLCSLMFSVHRATGAAIGTNERFILWDTIKCSNVFDQTFRTGNEPWSSVMEMIIDVLWLFR